MFNKIKNFFDGKAASGSPFDKRVEVPTVLQMEATECGAASFAMVLAHFGQWVPLERLRQECGVSRDGSKASSIVKAARARKCEVRGYRTLAGEFIEEEQRYPYIIHWEFNHFVVLEGVVKGNAYINDPAVGKRVIPWENFETSFTGVVIDIKPGEGFQPEGRPYSVYAAVAEKLRKDKWAVIFLLLLGLLMIVPGLATPVFSQIFLDDILSGKHGDWMFNLCIAMCIALCLSAFMSTLRFVVLTKWQKKLTLSDSSRFFWHVMRLPVPFFQQRYAAEVASRVDYNTGIAVTLSDSGARSLLDGLIVIFYLLLLLQYSIPLTLIGVSFSAVSLIVFSRLRRKVTDITMRVQQDYGKEYGTIMNGLLMIESIKAAGNEADFFAKWSGYRSKVLRGMQEIALWSLPLTILPVLMTGINSAIIITLGGFSIMEGTMTAGIFMAFQSLMNSFQEPVNRFLGLGSQLQSTEMQMRRIDDVLRYPIDALNYPPRREDVPARKRLSGKMELRNLCFGYSPLEPPLLSDFNLTLLPGRWVAIVGFSGSGKSTLSKIVTGLYEEWSGEVLFDGVPRREIPRQVMVASLASVDQDVFLISGTIRENISLFDATVRQSDIIQAAKDACIHDDILKLDGGYDFKVSEGGLNFSGGQRQRLEIARALSSNPSILVLDEATSALDPITEQKVLMNIRRRGCACFIVAHRLSTIRDCDEIVVLDRGKVVERGTHREMAAHEGPYRRLIAGTDKEG